MNTIQIRQAEDHEYEAVKALVAMFPEALLQTHLPGYRDFFLAVLDGVIVGCCALEVFYKSGEVNPRLAEIRSLAVRPGCQRRGAGGMLVGACIKRAKDASVYEVFAFTNKPELFERYGVSTFNGAKYAVFRVL